MNIYGLILALWGYCLFVPFTVFLIGLFGGYFAQKFQSKPVEWFFGRLCDLGATIIYGPHRAYGWDFLAPPEPGRPGPLAFHAVHALVYFNMLCGALAVAHFIKSLPDQ